jgi:uncharacterized membrane protein
MKLFNLLFKRDTTAPVLALMFASIASIVLVGARVMWTRNLQYAFLAWNLFLAWMPLLFALLARDAYRAERKPTWRFWALTGAWLLFFPNAHYIWTDIIHLWTRWFGHFWVDLTLILLCAFTGLVLGFVSLYLMQSVVARLFGRAVGWLFVVAAVGLSSFGVFLGRFMRFNSWDVFVRPGKVYHGIDAWVGATPLNHFSMAFLLFFAAFMFLAYVMLYALTHLPRPDQFGYATAGEAPNEA